MDKDQKREIVRLRLCGQGYRRIAKEVGLTRDIVRNFCKSRGLDGYGWNGVEIIEEKIAADKGLCLECGMELEQPPTGRRRKFCSDECRRKWWKRHPERVERKAYYTKYCDYCGVEFKAYGNDARKYCSHECYIRDRFYQDENTEERHIKKDMRKKLQQTKDGVKQRNGLCNSKGLIPIIVMDELLDELIASLDENISSKTR